MRQKLLMGGIAVLVLLAAITVHGVVVPDAPATATQAAATDEAAPETIGRYQVSSFTGDPQTGNGPGYYIIDTATGELWMNFRSSKPSRVSGPIGK